MTSIHDEFQINDALVRHYNANLPLYVVQHPGEVVRLTFQDGAVNERFYASRGALPPRNCLTRMLCLTQEVPVAVEGHKLRTFRSFLEEPDVVPSKILEKAILEAVHGAMGIKWYRTSGVLDEAQKKRLAELSNHQFLG